MVRTMWAGTDLYMHVHVNTNLLSLSSQYYGVYCDVIYKTFFFFDFRNGHLPLAKYLIEDLKCSPTCTDTDGETPLHHACR